MSRFLRFFRVFVVAVICGFGAFSANAATINVCDDFSDAGSACVRFDSTEAGAPTSFTAPLSSNSKLTQFPYRPGYGYAGHWTARNCTGTQILDHTGVWTGNSVASGNIYACWVPLVYGGLAQASTNYKLFVLDGNGGSTGNMWPGRTPIVFNTIDVNYGGNGRAIRFENRGDWVYLYCQFPRSGGSCDAVLWRVPRDSGGNSFYNSSTELFTTMTVRDGSTGGKSLPTRQGYSFGGMYSTSSTGGTQYCNASGDTINMALHSSNFGSLSAFNTIHARWNRLKVNLSGNGVSPNTVYLQYGDNWYPTLDGTIPITQLSQSPTPGSGQVFDGYYTGENCQGTQIVNADRTFRTNNAALTAITEDDTTIYPCWNNQATWATLTINNQNGSIWSLYYPLSGCAISGYHTSPDCLSANVVTSINIPNMAGWVYGGHWTGRDGTNLDGTLNPYIGTDGALLRAITGSTTVYAKWTFGVSYVAGTGASGSQTTGPTVCTYGTSCIAPIPTFTPPSATPQFNGWACKVMNGNTELGDCNSATYDANIDISGATGVFSNVTGVKLTATWVATAPTITYYTVTLNNGTGSNYFIYERDGVGFFKCNGRCSTGATQITASIFEPVSNGGAGLTKPTSGTGIFSGYYYNGTKVIDENGNILATPNFTQNRTWIAQYTNQYQNVILDPGEGVWGSCNEQSINVILGGPLPSITCHPTQNGFDFLGYYDPDESNTEQYYDGNLVPQYELWPTSGGPEKLVAHWAPVTYEIKYYCKDGNNPAVLARTEYVANGMPYTVWNGVGVQACANSAATSSEAGSKLVGWGNGSTGTSTEMIYSVGQNFGSFQITGNMNLSMVKKPIYYVSLNHCSDSYCSSRPISNNPQPSVAYFSNGNWYSDAWATTPRSAMSTKPIRTGYDFGGYYTQNGTSSGNWGTQVVNNSGNFGTGFAWNLITGNTSIYAQWSLRVYDIVLNRNGGSGGPGKLYYRLGTGWLINPEATQGVTSITTPNAPSGTNKIFGGYWTQDGSSSGDWGTQVVNGQGTIVVTGTEVGSPAMNLIAGLSNMTFYAMWDDQVSPPSDPNEYFAVTTTNLAANTMFGFGLTAVGYFYVDWGDGTIEPIVRDNTDPTVYSHTYSASGSKVIKIWRKPGTGVSYSAIDEQSAISFGDGGGGYIGNKTPELVAAMSGSLGTVFPTVNNGGVLDVPSFFDAFKNCVNLTSVSGNLFGYISDGVYVGVTGSRPYMFSNTFADTGLTSIPETLFGRTYSGIYYGAYGAASNMFAATFAHIPLDTDVNPISANLFAGVTGNAESLFASTFLGCTNLKSVPADLFSGVTGAAHGMFGATFMSSGLTSLPSGLFSGVTGTAENLFVYTFNGCSGLSGRYIPKDLFNLSGLTYDASNSMMTGVFANTGVATDCGGVNLTHYPTDYDDSYWDGKKICAPAAVFSCENPSVGGTPTGALDTIWMDQITGSTTLPAATSCVAPTHYTKPSTAYWACTGNSNCTGNPNHWAAGGTKPSWLTSSVTPSVNFYMEYVPIEYHVALNANGGTAGSVTTLYETYNTKWATTSGGTAITSLNANQLPTRTNWNFLGYWDTNAATGGNLMVAPDGTINALTTTLTGNGSTWYARWSQSTGPFDAIYSCGEHGTGTPGTQQVNYGQNMTLKAASVCTAATGYTFDKWKIMANGVEQAAGATYNWPLHSGSDIVAQWTPVQTTITLNQQGGTGGQSSVYTTYSDGVFRDSGRTQRMRSYEANDSYPLASLPYKYANITFNLNDGNSGNAVLPVGGSSYNNSNPLSVPINLPFGGYYSATSGGTKMIRGSVDTSGGSEQLPGYITSDGVSTGSTNTSNQTTWYARWNSKTVTNQDFQYLNITLSALKPQWAGHVFNGWWTAASGGSQITDVNGNWVDGAPSIDANTTWYAHWTECPTLTAANATVTPTVADEYNQCQYHIICVTDPGVPVGAGYSRYGGTDATSDWYASVESGYQGSLAGCFPRVYSIVYDNVYDNGHMGTMPSGDWYDYTYGDGKTINAVPTSPSEVFESWCDDLTVPSSCSASKTISTTDYGNKFFVAKWSSTCKQGYAKYSYDVSVTSDYSGQGYSYPAGACAPGNYVITCNSNCPSGETCNACLEDILSSSYHFGQRYGVYSQKFGTSQNAYDGVVGALGIVLNGQNLTATFPFGASSSIRPMYSLAGIGGWTENMSLPSNSVFAQDDYVVYMTQLAELNNKTFGRAHYGFNGLWTHQTSEEDQYRYLPTVNGTTPWSQRNADGKALSEFFTSDATVYSHWVPDVYEITLDKTSGSWKTGSVKKIYERWANNWSKNGTDYYTASDFNQNNHYLISSELPNAPTGYNFGGYYTEQQTTPGATCPGTRVINSNGKLNTSAAASTYGTVSDAKYFGTNATLYACWNKKQQEITLVPNLGGAHGTSSNITLYTKYATGVYTNSARTSAYKMSATANPVSPVPERYWTITYMPNYPSGSGCSGSMNPVNVSSVFNGYFGAATDGTKYINGMGDDPTYAPGYITTAGDNAGQGYTTNNNTWYAHWTNGSHDLVLAQCSGYFLDGWYDEANNGNQIGQWMETYTPSSDKTVYAHWTACNWTAGDNSSATYVAPSLGDGNSCKYHVVCDSGYTYNGATEFDEIKYSASGTLPGCGATGYTITYKDAPAYYNGNPNNYPEVMHTGVYSYNPNSAFTLWTPSSTSLDDHRASDITWCTNANGTNCVTNNQLPAGTTGDVTLYAKWECDTGYTKYAYYTGAREFGDSEVFDYYAGMCAPIRYRVNCHTNCPENTEGCKACLEDYTLQSNGYTYSDVQFGGVYNAMMIGGTTENNIIFGYEPIRSTGNMVPDDMFLFTKTPDNNYALSPVSYLDDETLYVNYGLNNYNTFMSRLATDNGTSFGDTQHYYFDGLWTADGQNGNNGDVYIPADGTVAWTGDSSAVQTFSKFFGSQLGSGDGTNNDYAVDVYAHWNPKVYTITLCPENGTSCTGGSMSGRKDLQQKWNTGWKIYPSQSDFVTATAFNNTNPLGNFLPTWDGYDFMGYYTAQNCGDTKIINADGTLVTSVSGISDAKYFGANATLYACWSSLTYNISYTLNGGQYGTDHPTSATYGAAAFHVSNPVNHPHGTFNGWTITNMQSEIQHNYGPTSAVDYNDSSDMLNLLGNTNIQWFQNLRRNNNATVLFTANWECDPGYSGADCTTAGTYTITIKAGYGVGNVSTSMNGWTGNGTATMTKTYNTDQTINLADIVSNYKGGYTGRAYRLADGSEGSISGNTFTVGAGNATIWIDASGITTPVAAISGGTTKVYNHQNTTLTGAVTNASSYDNSVSFTYQFTRADTENGTYSNVTTNGSTYSVAKDAYHGTKYYKVKITASGEGSLSSSVGTSSATAVTLRNARVAFNVNGGTLNGTSPLYAPYNVNSNLYSSSTSLTTDTPATVPGATRNNYDLLGWFSQPNGGARIYDENGSLQSNINVPGIFQNDKWMVTDPDENGGVTLHARWSGKVYTVTLDKNHSDTSGYTNPIMAIYEKYDNGWSTSENGDFGSLTLSGNQLPTRTGYVFAGFYDANGDSKGSYSSNGVWTAPGATTVTGATTWYAHWTPNTYHIQFNLNNNTTWDNANVAYNEVKNINNPTPVNNETYHQDSFAGWNVTNMESGITHFYGATSSNLTNGENGTSWNYVTITPSIKYFKNLRADTGTVLFEAVWNCVYPYQGPSCEAAGGVTVTVNAGVGIASVNGGTGWSNNGTSTITKTFNVGDQIDLSEFATHKNGYTGLAYVKASGEGTLNNDGTFTVGAGNAAIYVNATGITPPVVTLTANVTNQIYNYQPVTLTASNSVQYDDSITLSSYEFAGPEASSNGNNGTWTYVASEGNTKTVAKNAYLGTRYYKARITATANAANGGFTATGTSGSKSVTLNQKQLTFKVNAASVGETGGTLSDNSARYIRYDNASLYNSATGNTTKAVPSASLTGYNFAGYYTKSDSSDPDWKQIYNANRTLVATTVSGWIGNEKWRSTGAKTVYAHWTPKTLTITLNRGDATDGTAKFYEKYGVGYAFSSSATDWSAIQIVVPTLTGYDFAGYYANQEFTGGVVIGTDGYLPTDVNGAVNSKYFTENTTLYAKWTPKTYAVTYNCGGHGNGSTDSATYDEDYTVKTLAAANCDTSVTGATFGGWAVTPANVTKQPGDHINTWNYTAAQTFTAIWTSDNYTLTYSCGSGVGGTPPASWTGHYHDPITVANADSCSNPGRSFTGWLVTPANETRQPGAIQGGWPYTANQTFTAQWDTNTYNIQYNLGGGTRTLPVGYVPVEYITFNGNQVIDTGFTIGKGYEIQTKFYPTATGKYVYGALSSGNLKTVSGYVSTSGGNWRWGNKAIPKTLSLNSAYSVVQNASALTMNGTPVAYETQNNFETDVTLSIGKAHEGSSYNSAGFQGRIYWFIIKDDNGDVVYHGVPVKDTATGQYGLCNIVTGGTCVTVSGIAGPTATLPASYTYGSATTVSGTPSRANSTFNSWCKGTTTTNCAQSQSISATETGDKVFTAKWTCVTGYSSSNNSCVANNINLNWDENGGINLSNGSCTYNGDLNLPMAPTYDAAHVFNGWKTYNNSGIFAASSTVNGGCVQTYTGVTSGTSTAIQAQWCNACNPTHATCTLDASTPGTCSYVTACESEFYHYVSGQNAYNPVCEPYAITYQSQDSNGVSHGDGAVQEILSNPFTTNDANDSAQFNWANHIVTAWTSVSGGNFPNVGGSYIYNVQSDTVLKANWGECQCTPGTGATSCSTISSNNTCEVNEIICNTGFTGSSWSCEGVNCTATCDNDNRHKITLNKNGGTGGTTTLYTIYGTGSDAGVYINSARTAQYKMTPNPDGTNPITTPTLAYTISYNMTNGGTLVGNSSVQAVATFNGYYNSTTGNEQYIGNTRYITETGVSKGKGYTTNSTWYAQWTKASVTLPVAYRPGYKFLGWWTTPVTGGYRRGTDSNNTYVPTGTETLYARWEQCADGEYCPGVETVNNQTVYNVVHDCPTNYSHSALPRTIVSDCYLELTPGNWVQTVGQGATSCTKNYYCDEGSNDNPAVPIYYSDETNDGRRTTGGRKSCATDAGSFGLTTGTGAQSINACYKDVTLDKRGGTSGSTPLGGATGFSNGSTQCNYDTDCTLPDASILTLSGYTFYAGWTDQPDTDCNSTTRVFNVPDAVDTYYACRTTNSYTVALKDGLNTSVTFETVTPSYNQPMPTPLSVTPTHTGGNATYGFTGYYDQQTLTDNQTRYYNYDLTSAHDWQTAGNGTLYAQWEITCNPGYYLKANETVCSLCPAGKYCDGSQSFIYVPWNTDQGITGNIAAGYYSTGGASTATPTAHVTSGDGCYGQVNNANTACGLVAGGYYSTGGGTSATPTGTGNGCLSGKLCGKLGKLYFSNGGGTTATPTGTANAGCVSGQTCGKCPNNYQSSTTIGKLAITECTATCVAGTQVETAETLPNNPSSLGCTTPEGNWYSPAEHTVNYGSASTHSASGQVRDCATNYTIDDGVTPVMTDHDEQQDCKRTVALDKNGGSGIIGDETDPDESPIYKSCSEGQLCEFGDPSVLQQPGWNFLGGWGTTASCDNSSTQSIATPTESRYYACKNQLSYTLTYACGDGATGTPPAQVTGIHYDDTVSVSGVGNCAKMGHAFAGWAVSDTTDIISSTTWPHGITWNYEESKTFTAQWTANTYRIHYDANGGTSGSILPDGYTQLGWIRSTGTQWIDTGYVLTSSNVTYKWTAKDLDASGSKSLFGSEVDTNPKYSGILYGNNTGRSLYVGSSTSRPVNYVSNDDAFHSWVLDITSNGNVSLSKDGVVVRTNTYTAPVQQSRSIGVFGNNGRGQYASVMLKGFQIVDNNVLKVNLVPAQQNSDGAIGLYDTVTGVFLRNSGSGTFDAGDTVVGAYPNQYTYGVGTTVTGGAVRANSRFEAWCRNETPEFTECAAPHEITATDMGDMTLHAKWGCVTGYHLNSTTGACDVNEFTLVYNKNGHGIEETPANQTCTYGQEIPLAGALSETGWLFNGWTIAGENYAGGHTIICNEEYLGVTGGTVAVDVNVTADWSARCNRIILNKNSNDAQYGSIKILYAKTREDGSTVNGKLYKDSSCTTEYTSADYQSVIPTRSGWAFRGFYATSANATAINATQTNGAARIITHSGALTSTGQTFVNGLNANTILYAGWAQNCVDPVAHGTCSRTVGQNTTYTTTCATGYHYGTAPNGVTYNPATSGNTSQSTYYPNCEPNTITITLNKNGGTGTCGGTSGTTAGTLTCTYDGTCNTPVWGESCQLAKNGKVFAGWNTAADGTGTQYGTATEAGNAQNMNDGTSSTTLYAVWQDVTCTVTNGSATASVDDNTPQCDVTCNTGYETSGTYTGTQHATSVTTGQCNASTYSIDYEWNGGVAYSSALPDGYTQLEYIQSDGNVILNTQYSVQEDDVLELHYKLMPAHLSKTGDKKMLSGTNLWVETYGTNNQWWARFGSSSSVNTAFNSNQSEGVLVLKKNAVIVNGTQILSPAFNATLGGLEIFGSLSSGNPAQTAIMQSSGFNITRNGQLIMNLVPAQQSSSGEVGMYDTVSGTFFTKTGSGTFTAGPDVTVPYPGQYTYGVGATVYGVPTRANSVFDGWCRNAALTDGCTMVPHAIAATETGDKLLHAKWSCVDGYTLNSNNQCIGNPITIDYQNGGHGGTAPNDVTKRYGDTLTLANAMYDPRYDFGGWMINGTVYNAGDLITLDHDTLGVYSGTVPVVAQWAAGQFMVTYDCNTAWPGAVAPGSRSVSTGETFPVSAANSCVNPGYRFVKWAVSNTSPQEYWNAGATFEWNYAENKTFSAVWERDENSAFTVTVDMPANTEFAFTTIAAGQFWVDWGDNEPIETQNTLATVTEKTWTHTYATAGEYVIKIGGSATGYYTGPSGTSTLTKAQKSAISFFNGTLSSPTALDATVTAAGTEQYITAVSGKLGAIFPTITAGSWGGQPRFYRTFKNTKAMDITLQSIGGLFKGISGQPLPYMFAETFDGSAVKGVIPDGFFMVLGVPQSALFLSTFRNCTELTGIIPTNLFADISGTPAVSMFNRTFTGCTGLTGMPSRLFRNISGAPAASMFASTFMGCSSMGGTLSSDLFGRLNGPAAASMFDQTFSGCSSIGGTIPENLFGNMTGSPKGSMFRETFKGTGLTGSIPQGLFGGISGAPANYMFYGTFQGCAGLTGTIPATLFNGISGAPAMYMFYGTFQECTGLTGVIPAGLFSGISGAPAQSMFNRTFDGCTGLSGIGGPLFKGINGGPMANSMFHSTFNGCSNLAGPIPELLFGTPSGAPGEYMFTRTFMGCSKLTGEIPSDLFGRPSGPAVRSMFYQTFDGCSGLTGTIPSHLFGTMSDGAGAVYMFYRTFYNCSGLTGYVPEGLFGRMIVPDPVPDGMMLQVFLNSGLDTECPCGTVEVPSDFKQFWRSSSSEPASVKKVSCKVDTEGSFYWYNGRCTTACPVAAMDELHVGNLNPYMVLADKVSTVAVNIKSGNTICYVPLAAGNGGTNSLNMKYGDTVYHADRPTTTAPAGFGQR